MATRISRKKLRQCAGKLPRGAGQLEIISRGQRNARRPGTYQGVRASVKLNDLADATNLLAQLLKNFPPARWHRAARAVAESQLT